MDDEVKVAILEQKQEVLEQFVGKLDSAIEKIAEVNTNVSKMLAVHEEKITNQQDAIIEAEQKIEVRRNELSKQIDDLHSRITTNTKEIMAAAAQQHIEQNKEIQKIKEEITN